MGSRIATAIVRMAHGKFTHVIHPQDQRPWQPMQLLSQRLL